MASKNFAVPPPPPSIKERLPKADAVKKFVCDYVAAKQPIFDKFMVNSLKENGGSVTFDFLTKYSHYFMSTVHFISSEW